MSDESPTNVDDATAAAGAAQAAERAERAAGEARATEIRENVAMTDARRAEEEVARAHEEAEKAAEQEESLSRKERKLREKAERVHAEADRMRAQADEAAASRAAAEERAPHTVSGASAVSPGIGIHTDPDAAASASGGGVGGFPGADRLPTAAQRPEVLAGAAFGGAFIVARILKRIFD
jgi:hypothetical protein